jgi:hypothetical protein
VKSRLTKIQVLCAVVVCSLVLMGADGGGRADAERSRLEAQASSLQKKIAVLRREEDFLLFQKAVYSTDSKYLIINIAKRTAQLKYKNRVLQDFRFKAAKKIHERGFPSGMLVLTKKREGKNDQNTLIFGTSLVLQWKRTALPKQEAGIPVILFPQKEMLSVYYAVEEGALAYLLR